MSQESKNPKQQQLATNSSNTYNTLSTDISNINISSNDGEVSSSVSGCSGGSEEMKSSKKKDTSCAQNQLEESDEIISDESCLKILHQKKIVQSVCCQCHIHMIMLQIVEHNQCISHVVERNYVMGAYLYRQMK